MSTADAASIARHPGDESQSSAEKINTQSLSDHSHTPNDSTSEPPQNSERLEAYVDLLQQVITCPAGEEVKVLQTNQDLLDAGLMQVLTYAINQAEAQQEPDAAQFLRQLMDALKGAAFNAVTGRVPAYLKLIDALLSCDAGDEEAVLEAHRDLVDEGFVHLLGQTAGTLLLQGEEQAAYFLIALGRQLAVQLGLATIVETPDASTPNGGASEDSPQPSPSDQEEAETASSVYPAAIDNANGALPVQAGAASPTQDDSQQNTPLQIKHGDRPPSKKGLGSRIGKLLMGLRGGLDKEPCDMAEPLVTEKPSPGPVIRTNITSQSLTDQNQTPQELTADDSGVGESQAETRSPMLQNEEPEVEEPEVEEPGVSEDNDNPSLPYFLLRLLQVTKDANGDAATVYRLMQTHADQLSRDDAVALKRWAHHQLKQVPDDVAQAIAQDLTRFGTLCLRSPVADRRVMLEIAIAAYEGILGVIRKDTSPVAWAAIQNNLAIAYSDRTHGTPEQHQAQRAEDLEQAITHYHKALEIYTEDTYPNDWAMTQNNLALVYRDRQRGNAAQNLERAIACHQDALRVYTPTAMPQAYGITQINLGQVYERRIEGDALENTATAIAHYESALQIFTRHQHPEQWAKTSQHLKALQQHFQQQKQETVTHVSQDGIDLGDYHLPPQDIIPLITRYDMLPHLLAEMIVDRAIKHIRCTPEEEQQHLDQFHQQLSTLSAAEQDAWLGDRQLTETELPKWVTRALRIQKFKIERWGLRVESYFLKRKNQLDQVTYKLLRNQDAALIQELYFRLQNEEEPFSLLAQQYSQGPESQTEGKMGPVELGQLPPALADVLLRMNYKQILGPIQVGDVYAIVQLDNLTPARLDDAMRQRLMDELFHNWLQADLKQALHPQSTNV